MRRKAVLALYAMSAPNPSSPVAVPAVGLARGTHQPYRRPKLLEVVGSERLAASLTRSVSKIVLVGRVGDLVYVERRHGRYTPLRHTLRGALQRKPQSPDPTEEL